jgi:hypothetical protein
VVTVAVTARATPPPITPAAASVIGETLTATPTPAASAPAAPAVTVAMKFKTSFPQIPPISGSGYSWTAYGPVPGTATLSGTIANATASEVIRLYASQFPFSGTPSTVGSDRLTPAGGKASYSFKVSPALATRYQVKLFASSSASTPIGTSAVSTIYVIPESSLTGSGCDVAPTCTLRVTYTFYMPPSVLASEMAKRVYSYFAVTYGPAGTSPAAPKSMTLNAGNAVVGAPVRVSADSFTVTQAVSFAFNNGAATPRFTICQRDTEAQDGLGLPGSRGCGSPSVPGNQEYDR